MATCVLRLRTGSRLHFGLLSFGQPEVPQFGGAGLMIDAPGITLRAEPLEPDARQANHSSPLKGDRDGFRCDVEAGSCELRERVVEFSRRWCEAEGRSVPVSRLVLEESIPEHVGLGSGTQLGLAVAAMLYRAAGQETPAPELLSQAVGRGLRSSIGTFGFQQGGFLVEYGKLPDQKLSPLAARVELPGAWRVVLVRPRRTQGLFGTLEKRAFRELPAVPLETTARLRRLLEEQMLPAAQGGELERFGAAVHAYGREAGLCFAPIQGGPFATPELEAWVEAIRGQGVSGVGQSSWGPTLFALVAGDSDAQRLVDWFQNGYLPSTSGRPDDAICSIARVANRGAEWLSEA